MRLLKYFLLMAILAVPVAYSQAQVRFGVQVGGPAYYGSDYAYGPPVCTYGYYGYYPYACAPYGYWGPNYFVGGFFVGAGPWFHGFRGFDRRDGFRRFEGGSVRGGFRGGTSFRGGSNFQSRGNFQGGGNFRGGSNSQGGGNFRGGGNFQGGGGSHGASHSSGGGHSGGGGHSHSGR